jgi:hypothetical protein
VVVCETEGIRFIQILHTTKWVLVFVVRIKYLTIATISKTVFFAGWVIRLQFPNFVLSL